jgi:hypothetical protein
MNHYIYDVAFEPTPRPLHHDHTIAGMQTISKWLIHGVCIVTHAWPSSFFL